MPARLYMLIDDTAKVVAEFYEQLEPAQKMQQENPSLKLVAIDATAVDVPKESP